VVGELKLDEIERTFLYQVNLKSKSEPGCSLCRKILLRNDEVQFRFAESNIINTGNPPVVTVLQQKYASK